MRAFVLFALVPRLDRPIAPAVLPGRRVATGFASYGVASADVACALAILERTSKWSTSTA